MSAWAIPSYAEWAVPGYTEERLLGHGVSGRVVAAVNETTGQRVAIKYFDANLVRDNEFLWEVRAEAEQLKSLNATHTVRVFDYVEQPGQGAAVVMELIDGVSLREMISRRGPLSAAAALVVLKDSLLGLAAGHSRRVPHRDVKPDNVLIDTRGWCTLTDFGVAVKTDKQMPAAGAPAYMAPELWNGSPNVPASDMYAATAVLCESLAGKPPFSGGLGRLRRQHESAPVPLAQFDPPLQDLVARGMAKNPADRPRSAMSFVGELDARAAAAYGPDWEDQGRRELAERVAAVLPLLAGGGGGSATATRRARRKVLTFVTITAGVMAVLLVAGAVVLSRESNQTQLSSSSAAPMTAQVTVTPPVVTSKCTTATAFTYSGTVTATEAGTVSYQWLYSSGKLGPVQTLNFTAAGHQAVNGGTVQASKTGSGWAEIKVLSPVANTSPKATYKLLCGTASSEITVSASVQPASQTVSSCAKTAAPGLTATGVITSKKAGTFNYYWALSDGQDSPTNTITFASPGTKSVPPQTFWPSALPASGEAVLVVTRPVAATSSPAAYTVSCTTTVAPTASARAATATSSRSSASATPTPTTTSPTPTPTTTSPTPTPTATSPTATPTTTAPTPTPTTTSPTPTPTTTSPTPAPTTTTTTTTSSSRATGTAAPGA